MSKFLRNMLIGAAVTGCGVVAYKKLLTPEAQAKASETANNLVATAKNYIEEYNSNSEKDAKLSLIKTIEKTDEEWARIGY